MTLSGSWIHAHEEDLNDLLVFHPASRPVSPSRGRTGFSLAPDGTMSLIAPGRDDRPALVSGTWQVKNQQLHLSFPDDEQQFEIISADPDKLVLRRIIR
jgi:hypothetical protein